MGAVKEPGRGKGGRHLGSAQGLGGGLEKTARGMAPAGGARLHIGARIHTSSVCVCLGIRGARAAGVGALEGGTLRLLPGTGKDPLAPAAKAREP